jgi:hypothetical protein
MSEVAISRRKVLAEIDRGLAEGGYQIVPGPAPCGALYYRRLDDLVLTFGLEFHTIRPEAFTGSFYLSRSFTWSTSFVGFPKAAFQRVGPFLPTEERAGLLADEFAKPGIVEAWWLGFRRTSAQALPKGVLRAEARFLAQPDLAASVRASEGLAAHVELLQAIIPRARALAASEEAPEGLLAQPKRPPIDIPPRYNWAAELTLAELRPDACNPRDVPFFATDAFRVAALLKPAPAAQ